MSTMLVELYDALKEAGASEAKARAAAESLVLGRDRLERIEEQTDKIPKIEEQTDKIPKIEEQTDKIPKIEEQTDKIPKIEERTGRIPKVEDQIDDARGDIARLDREVAVVRAQIEPLKWMNGIVIAGVLALIIKTFFG